MNLPSQRHSGNAPFEPVGSDPKTPRDHIALRWHIDADDRLQTGWPHPHADLPQAMGWVAADRPIGVIEFPCDGLSTDRLNELEDRFPGRRWFAGAWDTPSSSRAAA